MADKRSIGIYRKFKVIRTDGNSDPGKKHAGCAYFVLDLDHDPFAVPALRAYAEACREQFPALAQDLDRFTEGGMIKRVLQEGPTLVDERR